jgi:hypothetical protein
MKYEGKGGTKPPFDSNFSAHEGRSLVVTV